MRGSAQDVKKRRESIQSYLFTHGKASTQELAGLCGTSEVTIRRDLEQLSHDNLIIRTHGGARVSHMLPGTYTYQEKDRMAMSSKQAIAGFVADMIPEGVTVFCNSGTTIYALIELLSKKNLTLVTNNAHQFPVGDNAIFKLISTGGVYNRSTDSFVGELPTKIINSFQADICVLGAAGISADFGMSSNDLGQSSINQAYASQNLGKLILAADGSKIGKKCYFRSLYPEQIDIIVTDMTADQHEVKQLRDKGIEVIQV